MRAFEYSFIYIIALHRLVNFLGNDPPREITSSSLHLSVNRCRRGIKAAFLPYENIESRLVFCRKNAGKLNILHGKHYPFFFLSRCSLCELIVKISIVIGNTSDGYDYDCASKFEKVRMESCLSILGILGNPS